MTVAELINVLSRFDPNLPVYGGSGDEFLNELQEGDVDVVPYTEAGQTTDMVTLEPSGELRELPIV
jgi:hypothetical protein